MIEEMALYVGRSHGYSFLGFIDPNFHPIVYILQNAVKESCR